MNCIYKTPQGFFVDLGKIAAVYPATFVDHMGHGGWFVSYHIDIQLREAPIVFTRRLSDDEVRFVYLQDSKSRGGQHEAATTEGNWHHSPSMAADILAVHNLQREVDQLIAAWTAFRTWENSK